MILRRKGGSYPTVLRVFAYCPRTEMALVLLKSCHGRDPFLGEVQESELEAIDESGVYGNVQTELLDRADYLTCSPSEVG